MATNGILDFPEQLGPQSAIDLLSKMIAIPSISREEKAVADFLEKWIEEHGYVANRSGDNVWMLSPGFDASKPTILLNSHIDTVKPNNGWQRNPFRAVFEGDRLYGLGSNDAGASVVSLLHAYLHLIEKNQPYNLIFAATAEEEISGDNGIAKLLPILPPVHFAIVGEPTEMNAAIAEKGLLVLDCTVTGQSGHAAHAIGDNAIYKAIPEIEWFRSHRFEKTSQWLGEVKMTVTMIQAGTQHNVIPDRCTFVVDVRSNERYTNQGLLEEIRNSVSCEVNPRSLKLGSSHIDILHPAVQRSIRIGRTCYGSPTLSDMTKMNFPALKIGPGKSSRSHQADEFIQRSEIEEAIAIYIQLLDQLVIK
ncbi:M20 family metallo-hydrolase [Microbacter margulisiae]|uniref:Acetylornithine deacetylase n=1 Tax=Microbacter margulisiae TaxID=1350067 RepID=A0A7W5H2R3_9PORP|nr:M20 family metallo-hydrolase [Microbacter margulisiae]MBB3187716.1 acetylornithine deacetylase [Microbacter margulisiae]